MKHDPNKRMSIAKEWLEFLREQYSDTVWMKQRHTLFLKYLYGITAQFGKRTRRDILAQDNV